MMQLGRQPGDRACMAVGVALIMLVMVVPAVAQAQGGGVHGEVEEWNFSDEECAPRMEHTPAIRDPAAFIVLDKSHSMGCWGGTCSMDCDGDGPDECDYSTGETWPCSLWEIAECSLTTALPGLSSDVMVGFGLFPAGTHDGSEKYEHDDCVNDPCLASFDVEFAYNNFDDISPILEHEADELGGGYTPTPDALVMSRDVILNADDENLALSGILITDGAPVDSDLSDNEMKRRSIDAACDARKAGVNQYIVGLGGETDRNFNNLLAAAAGTGYCCEDPDDDCSGDFSAQIDPCDVDDPLDDIDWDAGDEACEGSPHAGNEEDFSELMLSIGEDIACTFAVDDQNWEEVPDDPEVARIRYKSEDTVGWQHIPHVSQSESGGSGAPSGGFYDGEGSCGGSEDFCHYGFCRDSDEPMACEIDDDCDGDDFCHVYLGCRDGSDYCTHDDDCGDPEDDYFCWHNICIEDEESKCEPGDHAYCRDEFDDDYACLDGYCRDTTNGLCPYGDTTWEHGCDDSNDWCHEKLGCIDNQECTTDSECDDPFSEGGDDICWFGACIDADSGGRCEYEGGELGGGWEFANSERNQVRVTGEYCSRLGDGSGSTDITDVETALACNCYGMYEGNWCLVPPGQADSGQIPNACPAGLKHCQDDMTYKCEMKEVFNDCGGNELCVRGQCIGHHDSNPNQSDTCAPISDHDCDSGQVCDNGICRPADDVQACDNPTVIPVPDSSCPSISLPLVPDLPGTCVMNRCLLDGEEPCEVSADCSGDARCYDGICQDECESCPFACPADQGGDPCSDECIVSFQPPDPSDPDDQGELIVDCPDGIDPGTESMRCGVGSVQCDGQNFATCSDEAALRPMPEVCDGLDNSCDGKVNNIEESWDDWRNCTGIWDDENWDTDEWGDNPCVDGDNTLQLEIEDVAGGENEGAACFERDACTCANGSNHAHMGGGADASYEEEFEAHIQGWDPEGGCRCGASMSF